MIPTNETEINKEATPTFLKLVRAKIAIDNQQKKSLARKCKVTRPQFSEMLHGDRIMPPKVKERLVKELELEPYVEKFGL